MSVSSLISTGKDFQIKVRAGDFYMPLDVKPKGDRLRLYFRWNPALLDVVKTEFEKRQWKPDEKCWEIPITQRNVFRLEVLQGKYSDIKPYERYDAIETTSYREAIRKHAEERGIKIYSHQEDMVNQLLVAHWIIWAAQMGVGKSLAAIIAAEMIFKKYGPFEMYWVGPRSALVAGRLEFEKWKSPLRPEFFTYEGLTERIKTWPVGKTPPQLIVFDEASKLKTPTSKRSMAAKMLADLMRSTFGGKSWIALLSGTPAPKNPSDWWHLCEVACPGFIREGHILGFTNRLAVIESRETVPGAGSYNHIVTWKDSDNKCDKCGQPKEHVNHTTDFMVRMTQQSTADFHEFVQAKNEVAELKNRLRGLVMVKLKEDCLDLPMKRYEVKRVKPSRSLLNAAKIITQTVPRAIEALSLLRQLSDGFQYVDEPTGETTPCRCGTGTILEYYNPEYPEIVLEEAEVEKKAMYVQDTGAWIPCEVTQREVTCPMCKGNKSIPVIKRTVKEVECPKDQVIYDELELHEEDGRINIFAGFTGSIDRVVRMCQSKKWGVVRADGRGWKAFNGDGYPIEGKSEDFMRIFQQGQVEHPFMAFVGQPGAAGMGITLTAAPSTIFFSNDFNGESRQQAEDRHHRIGMDVVRGGRIVDIIHLPTDEQVLENLLKKKELQQLSMKGLSKVFDDALDRS